MKKIYMLCALLFLTASVMNGQTITQTNTQFPNPGFEKWNEHSSASTVSGYSDAKWVPYNWHTFDEAIPDITLAGQSAATKNHHSRFTSGGINNSKYIGLGVNSVIGIKANGALSSGRTYVGSTSATSSNNYNFTNLTTQYTVQTGLFSSTTYTPSSNYSSSGHFSWSFVGCPDSMSFYYRTAINSSNVEPLFKVFLHGNGEFRDRADGSLYSSSSVPLIGSSVDTFTRYQSSTSWKRETYPFTYSTPGQGGTSYTFLGQNSATHPIYGYYTNLNRPTYMLASFSTDKTAGNSNQSDGDMLYIDELWCIYDKGLSSVSIGGIANATALSVFNAAEFAKHEPSRTYDANGNPSFNNSGTASWNYTADFCYASNSDFPQVQAMPKSKLITGFSIVQATTANHYATITVTHNDNSTFTYTINFTNAHPVPTVNATATPSTVCAGAPVTLTATGTSTYS